MTRTFAIFAALSALALTATTLLPADAEAKRGASRYQQWEFDTRRPVKGHEGFSGPHGRYCSYRREPDRKCWYRRDGSERCKVVGWRLIQKCY